eukprot:scaffold64930_cov58-Phaeocystis_antarctica.AAC.2
MPRVAALYCNASLLLGACEGTTWRSAEVRHQSSAKLFAKSLAAFSPAKNVTKLWHIQSTGQLRHDQLRRLTAPPHRAAATALRLHLGPCARLALYRRDLARLQAAPSVLARAPEPETEAETENENESCDDSPPHCASQVGNGNTVKSMKRGGYLDRGFAEWEDQEVRAAAHPPVTRPRPLWDAAS